MKRSGPLRRTTGLQRKTRIRPRSAKRAKIMRDQRVPLVQRLLAERPWCERCGTRRSTEVHEKQKRSRNPHAFLDEALCAALCRACHEWTEREPAAATVEGWLIPSWENREGAA